MIQTIICIFAALATLTSAALAHGQAASKPPRIGYISGRLASSPGPLVAAFRAGLRKLGYVEGKNIIVEYRYDASENEGFQRSIKELLNLKVDLLVVPLQVPTAKRLAQTTPIVMISNFDPVDNGVIYSLDRPGGNITGVTTLSRALSNRRLELLKEIVPQLARLGVLRNTDSLSNSRMRLKEIEVAARERNANLELFDVHGAAPNFDGAFEAAAKTQVDALLTLTPLLINHQQRIAELALKRRLPTVFEGSTWVEAGGLMSYSADELELFRSAAAYVDKILKGAKPSELPVEEPKKFEFVINQKTAKAINLAIPPSVLQRADKVIR